MPPRPPEPDIGAIYADHIVAALFCPLLNTWEVQQSIFFKQEAKSLHFSRLWETHLAKYVVFWSFIVFLIG